MGINTEQSWVPAGLTHLTSGLLCSLLKYVISAAYFHCFYIFVAQKSQNNLHASLYTCTIDIQASIGGLPHFIPNINCKQPSKKKTVRAACFLWPN